MIQGKELELATILIEDFKIEINIRVSDKCYMPMFKYPNLHWYFSLPIQNMYLMTLEDSENHIEKARLDDLKRNIKCDYKIAKIIQE